jgi:hypothetical protein
MAVNKDLDGNDLTERNGLDETPVQRMSKLLKNPKAGVVNSFNEILMEETLSNGDEKDDLFDFQ